MFVRTGEYHPFDYYTFESPTKRQLRTIAWIDDFAVRRFIEGDRFTRFAFAGRPFTKRRIVRLVTLLSDRTRSVHLEQQTYWTPGLGRDLSVEVLENRRPRVPKGMSISLNVIEQAFTGKNIDFNWSWESTRIDAYRKLLHEYFRVTTDLDLIYRAEPDCSEAAKQLLMERLEEYAGPTRALLVRMMSSLASGSYAYDAMTKAVDELTASWGTEQAALDARQAYAIEQADRRVQAFLNADDFVTQQADARVRALLEQQ